MQTTAPIILFTYKRLASLKRLIASLLQNPLAASSTLIIYSDAARNPQDAALVKAVREYLPTISGFSSVHIHLQPQNKGLGNSIIEGVSDVIAAYGAAIVLEDDLIVSNNFLAYMNQSLDFYKNDATVLSIAGYTMPVQSPKDFTDSDVYFTQRASSWGWATWADRWENVDWSVEDYTNLRRDRGRRRRFNAMGSDLFGMLKKQQLGKNNSWAIRFCYHQFKYGLYTVYPLVSKVVNMGFDEDATHTVQKHNRFKTMLDRSGRQAFHFCADVELNQLMVRQFTRLYSIPVRAIYKFKNLLPI